MKNLWAPWRMEYIGAEKKEGCIFCVKDLSGEDAQRRVVYRGRHSFVMMNAFPYNSGHVMVAPYGHVACLSGLRDEVLEDLFRTVRQSVEILKEVFRPDGLNVGLNLGAAAGAGFEEHLHVHVVPRWNGDCNFMPVLADTKVLPEHLDSTRAKLERAFGKAVTSDK